MPSGIFRLDHNTNISSLEEGNGTRTLAMTGPGNAFGNATNFLRNVRQLQPNQPITVVSGPGTSTSVIFMLDASAGAVAASKAATKVGGGAVRGGVRRKAANKSTRKAASKTKRAASKSTKKAASKTKTKTTKKRSTGKAAKKRSTKKSAKKSSRK